MSVLLLLLYAPAVVLCVAFAVFAFVHVVPLTRSAVLVHSVCQDEKVKDAAKTPDAGIITTVAVVVATVVATVAISASVATAVGCCSSAAITTTTTVAAVATAGVGVASGGTAAAVHLIKKHGLKGWSFENSNVTRVEAQLQALTSPNPITGLVDAPLVTLREAIDHMLELLHNPKYGNRLKSDSNASILCSSIMPGSLSTSSILSDDTQPSAPPVPPSAFEDALSLLQQDSGNDTAAAAGTVQLTKSHSTKKIRRRKTRVAIDSALAACPPAF